MVVKKCLAEGCFREAKADSLYCQDHQHGVETGLGAKPFQSHNDKKFGWSETEPSEKDNSWQDIMKKI